MELLQRFVRLEMELLQRYQSLVNSSHFSPKYFVNRNRRDKPGIRFSIDSTTNDNRNTIFEYFLEIPYIVGMITICERPLWTPESKWISNECFSERDSKIGHDSMDSIRYLIRRILFLELKHLNNWPSILFLSERNDSNHTSRVRNLENGASSFAWFSNLFGKMNQFISHSLSKFESFARLSWLWGTNGNENNINIFYIQKNDRSYDAKWPSLFRRTVFI